MDEKFKVVNEDTDEVLGEFDTQDQARLFINLYEGDKDPLVIKAPQPAVTEAMLADALMQTVAFTNDFQNTLVHVFEQDGGDPIEGPGVEQAESFHDAMVLTTNKGFVVKLNTPHGVREFQVTVVRSR